MSEVVRARTMSGSPEAVWAVLADFGSIVTWAPNVDHSCLMSGQSEGVGTVRRIQSGHNTIVERVIEWDPPTTLAYALEGLPPVVRSATNTWSVEPAGQGSRVALTSRVDAGPRPPQQLIARAIARRMAHASDEMLVGIDERVS